MAQKREGLLNNDWEKTQIKVFSRWTAKQLMQRQIPFENVLEDFKDGVKLINLLEIVSKEPIGKKYDAKAKTVFSKRENINTALLFIQKKGIKMVGIGEEDILNGHPKLTLGLIWTIINKFLIEEISVEEATARDALLIWAKKNTQGYKDVDVKNFTTSWSSGLAFCALINKFRPNLLDFDSCSIDNATENCNKAFAACKELGIYVYLDPEDLVDTQPDEKSVVTQVAEFFHFFSAESKTQAMADKLKRTLQIQKQIDEFKDTYVEEAKACVEKIEEEEAKLKADDFENTVPGVKGKLLSIISYSRKVRPDIVEHRAKAMKAWGVLSTKCNSNNRPIPAVPEGLEPESLQDKFASIESTSSSRRTEISNQLSELQKQKISEFDSKANEITEKIEAIEKEADSLEGEAQEKIEKATELLNQANEISPEIDSLEEPYQELIDIKLNNRVKTTPASVKNSLATLISHIKHISEQLKGKLFQDTNSGRVDEYNQKASPYEQAATEFKESCSAIAGELVERRTAYLAKQAELPEKRDSVKELEPDFAELEKDGLHLTVEHTPTFIQSIYNAALQIIVDGLNKCYDEMVANFDAVAVPIIEEIGAILAEAKALEGEPKEIKEKLEEQLQKVNAVEEKIPPLEEPFNELVEFKLNFRAKYTSSDALEEYQQAVASIQHLITSNDAEITELDQNARINAYTSKADEYMEEANKLDTEINNVTGELQEKKDSLSKINAQVNEKIEQLPELTPLYEDLEKDELHLEISNTPDSIKEFFENLTGHITTLINQIDQEIVNAKGLEVTEEQLAEYREIFTHYDKDNSQELQYYEFKACLTSFGEDITDDEAKEYCKKYSATGKDSVTFDEYVKFMLDYFSKAETKDSTLEAFKAIAAGNPILNDSQIAQYFSEEDAEYLKKQLTPVEGGYDFAAYVDTLYA